MTSREHGKQCKALAKDGNPCRAAATEGGLCFFHSNPNKASELGRIGGRKNRHAPVVTLDSLPNLLTASAVRDAVAQLIGDVYSEKIDPKIVIALSALLKLQLRAIETTDLEQRIAKVELKEGQGTGS
jgi:Family of unknown function (DUF5763)